MARISRGGGPIIPPGGAHGPDGPKKTDFATKIQGPAQATDSARTEQSKATQKSQLTGKAREIAKRLDSGIIDQRQATREFVGVVIEERFPKLKKKKKRNKEGSPEEDLEEAITDLIEEDPNLAQRLSTEFQKLSKEGMESG